MAAVRAMADEPSAEELQEWSKEFAVVAGAARKVGYAQLLGDVTKRPSRKQTNSKPPNKVPARALASPPPLPPQQGPCALA